MLKAYKYKLAPNEEQKILLNKHFGCVRFIYNYFLNKRNEEYKDNKITISYYDNCADLTKLKTLEETNWLKEVNSQSLQHSLKHLDVAYGNFFKGKSKFPIFKSKNNKNSFTVPQKVRIKNKKLYIPKFNDGIDVILHRKYTGNIKQCTISKTCTKEYFVSILVETIHTKLEKTNKSIGIDLGLKHLAITSDGYKYKNNKYTKQYAKKLKKAQQHLSHKIVGSNRFNKQKLKVGLIHKKITNSRKDNLHKVSTELITKYDTIFIENLNIKGMSARCKSKQDKEGNTIPSGQSKKSALNRSILDASWGMYIDMLKYKADWNDKQIVEIDRFYPSSKACNCCGYINQNLRLNIRSWQCPKCHVIHDRDINAAKNIYNEGLKKLSSGTDDYKHRDQIRPINIGTVDEVFKILN